jgi:sn-glycerol 3-phosphate transport system substrate-binding protein
VEISFWHGKSGPLGEELTRLTDAYNASQPNVKVNLVQDSYEGTADNYFAAAQGDRPDIVQLPEYQVQAMVDTESTVPVGKCIESSGFDTSAFLPTALAAYATAGVQWAMPFNLSNPVLFYNKKMFAAAGLDPEKPPTSLDEMRAMSEKIVQSGAAAYGLALESGFDSGGGWYVEQWFCKAGEFYVDGDNGRTNRATKVLYDNQAGIDLMTFLQQMLNDKLAVNVGDNSASGYDNLLKMADEKEPAAMTINTSASLGPVLQVLGTGQFPQITGADVCVGPMPGPDGKPGALIGGAALWVVNSGDADRTAAAWDYLTYLVGAQQQSEWAVATGYVPVRKDALDLDPYKATVATAHSLCCWAPTR